MSLLLSTLPRLREYTDLPLNLQAGIDEAGRGALAGPVVAAAVIFPPGLVLDGLDDSKKISASRRTGLAARIGMESIAWGLGVVWMQEIDQLNILQASLKAMARAVTVLKIRPQALLIDGNQLIPEHFFKHYSGNLTWETLPKQRAIIDGDGLVPVISAASILAKTFRDLLMEKLDRQYPAYGFAKHKGYGSKQHLAALQEHGPCRLHRYSFKHVLTTPPQEQGSLC